jgi:hypothetical protein
VLTLSGYGEDIAGKRNVDKAWIDSSHWSNDDDLRRSLHNIECDLSYIRLVFSLIIDDYIDRFFRMFMSFMMIVDIFFMSVLMGSIIPNAKKLSHSTKLEYLHRIYLFFFFKFSTKS